MTATGCHIHEAASFWRYIASSLDRLVDLSQTIDPRALAGCSLIVNEFVAYGSSVEPSEWRRRIAFFRAIRLR
jgi:hypothetical protein